MTNLKQIINKANSIAIISHIRPDGDTLGGSLSLYNVCKDMGKNPVLLCESEIPQYFSFMNGVEIFAQSSTDKYDLVFAVDCGDKGRLGSLEGVFLSGKTKVNIDHHITNTSFGDVNFVNKQASSTCQLLYELYKKFDIKITSTIATHLYTGLSTDTGHFKHSNVNESTFLMAADLTQKGVDLEFITRKLYKENSKDWLRLLSYALSKIKYYSNDRICLMTLTKQEIDTLNCSFEDTEGLVGYCINQRGVTIGAIISQHSSTNSYKVSLRSKPDIDVSVAACSFGGGGHKYAAGCMMSGVLETVVEKVVKALGDCLENE
ncbi:MAG: bifunctional oligoribonuclease/PAP phosphatase NrnA [Clostridiales bacterium]|jgi:phosphoesterase RecJ-like protein|nr:bifunctional oligoribonuclease/PAP phosphatase NrnA [Clostridiales bacterium]